MPEYSQYPGESKERFKVRMARQAAKKGKYKDTNGDSDALKKLRKEFDSVFRSWKSKNVPPKYYRGKN